MGVESSSSKRNEAALMKLTFADFHQHFVGSNEIMGRKGIWIDSPQIDNFKVKAVHKLAIEALKVLRGDATYKTWENTKRIPSATALQHLTEVNDKLKSLYKSLAKKLNQENAGGEKLRAEAELAQEQLKAVSRKWRGLLDAEALKPKKVQKTAVDKIEEAFRKEQTRNAKKLLDKTEISDKELQSLISYSITGSIQYSRKTAAEAIEMLLEKGGKLTQAHFQRACEGGCYDLIDLFVRAPEQFTLKLNDKTLPKFVFRLISRLAEKSPNLPINHLKGLGDHSSMESLCESNVNMLWLSFFFEGSEESICRAFIAHSSHTNYQQKFERYVKEIKSANWPNSADKAERFTKAFKKLTVLTEPSNPVVPSVAKEEAVVRSKPVPLQEKKEQEPRTESRADKSYQVGVNHFARNEKVEVPSQSRKEADVYPSWDKTHSAQMRGEREIYRGKNDFSQERDYILLRSSQGKLGSPGFSLFVGFDE